MILPLLVGVLVFCSFTVCLSIYLCCACVHSSILHVVSAISMVYIDIFASDRAYLVRFLDTFSKCASHGIFAKCITFWNFHSYYL